MTSIRAVDAGGRQVSASSALRVLEDLGLVEAGVVRLSGLEGRRETLRVRFSEAQVVAEIADRKGSKLWNSNLELFQPLKTGF